MKKKTNWEDFLTKIISFSGVAEHDYRVLTWLNAADGIKITNKRGLRINAAPLLVSTQPFLVSSRNAQRDDTKNGCVADYTLLEGCGVYSCLRSRRRLS